MSERSEYSYILLAIKVEGNISEALDKAGDIVRYIKKVEGGGVTHREMPSIKSITVLNTIRAPE